MGMNIDYSTVESAGFEKEPFNQSSQLCQQAVDFFPLIIDHWV